MPGEAASERSISQLLSPGCAEARGRAGFRKSLLLRKYGPGRAPPSTTARPVKCATRRPREVAPPGRPCLHREPLSPTETWGLGSRPLRPGLRSDLSSHPGVLANRAAHLGVFHTSEGHRYLETQFQVCQEMLHRRRGLLYSPMWPGEPPPVLWSHPKPLEQQPGVPHASSCPRIVHRS